jgi:hypothetical protein
MQEEEHVLVMGWPPAQEWPSRSAAGRRVPASGRRIKRGRR